MKSSPSKPSLSIIGDWFHVGQAAVGAKDNSYHELVYKGPSSFVGAVKLVHTKGYMSNRKGLTNSYWGLVNESQVLATVITDVENRIIYPSPFVTQLTWHGLYRMPGYNSTSPYLVFSDFCAPQYFEGGRKIRIWYSEDLYDYTDHNNDGTSHMEVYFFLYGNRKAKLQNN
ncbi:Hypothetical predicted protein [Paramuricea clavata]|uniref:Uncharacterized protein n=2 Tax=Paramuricea clavata TaxID=317549 RepID=A0A6S7KUJ8_PARCT|nr:Hypothetical predicted protein [Paramuricea clavata]